MNRSEVEALLFRLNAAMPPRFVDQLLEAARVAEWFDSPLANVEQAVALEAFGRWKLEHDSQPSLRDFLGACRQVEADHQPALNPAPMSDEEQAAAKVQIEAIRKRFARRGMPDTEEERASIRTESGALVYAETAERLRQGEPR